MATVIIPLSIPLPVFEELEEIRKQTENTKTGVIFKRSPFFVEVLKRGLEAMDNDGRKL